MESMNRGIHQEVRTKDTVHEIVVEAIAESEEKDKRKPNLMMFNMKDLLPLLKKRGLSMVEPV